MQLVGIRSQSLLVELPAAEWRSIERQELVARTEPERSQRTIRLHAAQKELGGAEPKVGSAARAGRSGAGDQQRRRRPTQLQVDKLKSVSLPPQIGHTDGLTSAPAQEALQIGKRSDRL